MAEYKSGVPVVALRAIEILARQISDCGERIAYLEGVAKAAEALAFSVSPIGMAMEEKMPVRSELLWALREALRPDEEAEEND